MIFCLQNLIVAAFPTETGQVKMPCAEVISRLEGQR